MICPNPFGDPSPEGAAEGKGHAMGLTLCFLVARVEFEPVLADVVSIQTM
jgi:hypothetical protein